LAGVRVRAYLFIALVVSSVVAACAGVIVTAQVNSGSPTTGPSYLLPAYAAAFLGATQIRPGRMNVVGLLIANYMLATGVTGLQLGGARFWIPDLFNGAALVIAVGLSGLTVRRRKARANERERVELFGAPPAEDSPRVAPGGGESSENSVRDRPASLGR
jgi:ribose transport system permease protein